MLSMSVCKLWLKDVKIRTKKNFLIHAINVQYMFCYSIESVASRGTTKGCYSSCYLKGAQQGHLAYSRGS